MSKARLKQLEDHVSSLKEEKVRTEERLRNLHQRKDEIFEELKKLGVDPKELKTKIGALEVEIEAKLVEIEAQIDELRKEIIETANYKKINFFCTSIYDPYTIMSSMSQILLELYPKSELIQKTIEEFAKKLDCEGLMIIDKNSIILGSHFKDVDSKKLLSSTLAYFLTLNEIFLEMEIEQQEDQIVVRKSGKYFLFKPILLKDIDLPYYMLVLKTKNPFDIYFINKDFSAFVNIFRDIVKS